MRIGIIALIIGVLLIIMVASSSTYVSIIDVVLNKQYYYLQDTITATITYALYATIPTSYVDVGPTTTANGVIYIYFNNNILDYKQFNVTYSFNLIKSDVLSGDISVNSYGVYYLTASLIATLTYTRLDTLRNTIITYTVTDYDTSIVPVTVGTTTLTTSNTGVNTYNTQLNQIVTVVNGKTITSWIHSPPNSIAKALYETPKNVKIMSTIVLLIACVLTSIILVFRRSD